MNMDGKKQVDSELSKDHLLKVDSVSVEYRTGHRPVKALRDVSFTLNRNEVFGVAGESGSGKSTLGLTILRSLDGNGYITDGDIIFKNKSLPELTKSEFRTIRGNEIAYVPQHSDKSLNPSIKIGEQIAETVALHNDVNKRESREKAKDLLQEVEISDPEYYFDKYPHQLSGGMQQRVSIAIALSGHPELLILDEPTTGLDVTTQGKILDLVDSLKELHNTSILLITHNLGVIAEQCDRVGILYAGEIMEIGTIKDVFRNPSNPYTQGLLTAIPKIDQETKIRPIPGQVPSLEEIPDGCIFADRCEFAEPECKKQDIFLDEVSNSSDHKSRCRRWQYVKENPIQPDEETRDVSGTGETILNLKNVKKHFGQKSFFDKLLGEGQPVKAVDGVSFGVNASETLGLVGESGCGKSTLGKTILKLLDIEDGSITFQGQSIHDLDDSDLREFRQNCQIVFQNPDSSLNPRKRITEIVERPLVLFTDLNQSERKKRCISLLDEVGLGSRYMDRYPHELSGGEKQRVAIARAFAANPSFVVLDEPVSSLDVSLQASILQLLENLSLEHDTSYLFISHDLSIVNYLADRIGVMYLGNVMEAGSRDEIFNPPYHPYTRALLSNIPSTSLSDEREHVFLEGDVPSARDPPEGCPFHTRCPQKIGEKCEIESPNLEEVNANDDSHLIACHLEESEMGADLSYQ